jgi:hypothetical protein
MREYFGTRSKILRAGRGMAKKSFDLIEAMHEIAEAALVGLGRVLALRGHRSRR